MLRATVLCVLLALALEGSCGAGVRLNSNYREKLLAVHLASDVLDRLLAPQDYDVLKPELHYLALIQVALSAAGTLENNSSVLPAEVLLLQLQDQLPKVLESPFIAATSVLWIQQLTLDLLRPLNKVVDNLCDGVGDNECDRLVNSVVQNNAVLQYPVELLNAAADVATGVLAKNPRLEEVARSLDVVPYLVSNVNDAANYVYDISKLLLLILYRKS